MTSEEQHAEGVEEGQEASAAEALRKAKGKGPKEDSEAAEGDDDEEVDFDADEEEDSSDDDSSDDSGEEEEAGPPGEAEVEELEGGDDAAGPSSAGKRKRGAAGEGEPESAIVAGLSGDEVDPGLIISGGRGSRRGRPAGGAGARPKYTAAAKLDSDEDDW